MPDGDDLLEEDIDDDLGPLGWRQVGGAGSATVESVEVFELGDDRVLEVQTPPGPTRLIDPAELAQFPEMYRDVIEVATIVDGCIVWRLLGDSTVQLSRAVAAGFALTARTVPIDTLLG